VSWLQSFLDPGQNRESGGRSAERTDYAAGEACDDPNPATDGGH
jgi:hypothetical protein